MDYDSQFYSYWDAIFELEDYNPEELEDWYDDMSGCTNDDR